MKVIVDTNVILDALTGRQPWNKEAEEIFLRAAKGKEEYYITANTVTDIYYLLRKHLKNRESVIGVMSKLFQLFMILDTNAEDCINALHSEMKDYEDAVLAEVAKRNKVDYIVTRNVKDYINSSVEAVISGYFLKEVVDMSFTDEEKAVYVALDNGIAIYTPQNWMPPLVESDYREARNTRYFASWYNNLSEREKAIADEIAMRL